MSNDSNIDEYEDDEVIDTAEVDEDEVVSKLGQAKASLMKRRLIDEILEQKRVQKLLADFDDDYDDLDVDLAD